MNSSQTPFRSNDAADAFAPLSAAAYSGAIDPGVVFDRFEHNGNLHCSLGLRLEIGEGQQRTVRVSFLLKSKTARGIVKRDAETLAKWARLVGAPPVRNWYELARELCAHHELLGVDLRFAIRPASPGGRGYVLVNVEMES